MPTIQCLGLKPSANPPRQYSFVVVPSGIFHKHHSVCSPCQTRYVNANIIPISIPQSCGSSHSRRSLRHLSDNYCANSCELPIPVKLSRETIVKLEACLIRECIDSEQVYCKWLSANVIHVDTSTLVSWRKNVSRRSALRNAVTGACEEGPRSGGLGQMAMEVKQHRQQGSVTNHGITALRYRRILFKCYVL
jgi:hypothetical protein